MSVLKGCQEGKATPKLVEVKCPACGAEMEVFVAMGDSELAGRTTAEEKCPSCGKAVAEGTPIDDLEKV